MGIDNFSAVINPPQSCILAVGKSDKKAVFDASVKDTNLRWADVMRFTLSCDHRIVDGAAGARWIGRFKHYMENPIMMLV